MELLTVELHYFTIQVLNVWRTCEWYRQVFGLTTNMSPDGTFAHFSAAGRVLAFAAHELYETELGPRQLNSFLSGPSAVHVDITTPDVSALFAHAIAHGAVAVRPPETSPAGQCVATVRDLNGLLIRLLENEPCVASA